MFRSVQFLACFIVVPLTATIFFKDCAKPRPNTGEPMTAQTSALKTGTWGGDHIRVDVSDSGATIDYDCAHGTIDQKIVPDAHGGFNVIGTHIREHGGPVRKGETGAGHPAEYSGKVNGDKMTLTVRETDTNTTVGSYTLVYGDAARIMKCR
jgi:hypothetical protein